MIAQRALLVTLIVCVPLMLVWMYIQAPLVLLGQSASIVAVAVPYLLWISPQLPLGAINVVLEKYQMSQVRSTPHQTTCCLHVERQCCIRRLVSVGERGSMSCASVIFCDVASFSTMSCLHHGPIRCHRAEYYGARLRREPARLFVVSALFRALCAAPGLGPSWCSSCQQHGGGDHCSLHVCKHLLDPLQASRGSSAASGLAWDIEGSSQGALP